MRTLLGDNVICVDVDNTLVSWEQIAEHLPKPHPDCGMVEIEFDGRSGMYHTFPFNVESVQTHYKKGHIVVVWSGSGHEWAEAVVRALKMEDSVDIIMAKPKWLLDDMKPTDFMPVPYWGAGDPGKAKLK